MFSFESRVDGCWVFVHKRKISDHEENWKYVWRAGGLVIGHWNRWHNVKALRFLLQLYVSLEWLFVFYVMLMTWLGLNIKTAGGLTLTNIERWINRSHTAILVLFFITKRCLIYVVSSPLTPPPHLSPPELSNCPFTLNLHCDLPAVCRCFEF